MRNGNTPRTTISLHAGSEKVNARQLTARDVLISPCDGKATAFKIDEATRFTVKNTVYTVSSLLKNKELAAQFHGESAS